MKSIQMTSSQGHIKDEVTKVKSKLLMKSIQMTSSQGHMNEVTKVKSKLLK